MSSSSASGTSKPLVSEDKQPKNPRGSTENSAEKSVPSTAGSKSTNMTTPGASRREPDSNDKSTKSAPSSTSAATNSTTSTANAKSSAPASTASTSNGKSTAEGKPAASESTKSKPAEEKKPKSKAANGNRKRRHSPSSTHTLSHSSSSESEDEGNKGSMPRHEQDERQARHRRSEKQHREKLKRLYDQLRQAVPSPYMPEKRQGGRLSRAEVLENTIRFIRECQGLTGSFPPHVSFKGRPDHVGAAIDLATSKLREPRDGLRDPEPQSLRPPPPPDMQRWMLDALQRRGGPPGRDSWLPPREFEDMPRDYLRPDMDYSRFPSGRMPPSMPMNSDRYAGFFDQLRGMPMGYPDGPMPDRPPQSADPEEARYQEAMESLLRLQRSQEAGRSGGDEPPGGPSKGPEMPSRSSVGRVQASGDGPSGERGSDKGGPGSASPPSSAGLGRSWPRGREPPPMPPYMHGGRPDMAGFPMGFPRWRDEELAAQAGWPGRLPPPYEDSKAYDQRSAVWYPHGDGMDDHLSANKRRRVQEDAMLRSGRGPPSMAGLGMPVRGPPGMPPMRGPDGLDDRASLRDFPDTLSGLRKMPPGMVGGNPAKF